MGSLATSMARPNNYNVKIEYHVFRLSPFFFLFNKTQEKHHIPTLQDSLKTST